MKRILILLGILLLGAPVAFAGSIKEYSADMVDVKSGRVVSKLFVTERKIRVAPPDAAGVGAIIRMDLGTIYTLKRNRTYTESSLPGNTTPSLRMGKYQVLYDAAATRESEHLGVETVNGRQAARLQVTTARTSGRSHAITTATHFEWMAGEFDIPVRTQDEKGEILELRNIKVGPPDASVFEIPSGYTKAAPRKGSGANSL